MESFNESRFRQKVDAALVKVKTILDNEKKPYYAEGVPHQYEDKYLLAEALVNSGLGALVQAFEALGVTDSEWKKIHGWNKTRSVTLRLKAEEKCKFLRKVEREVKSDTTHVTQSTLFGTSKSYTVTKVTEWFWQFSVNWQLQLYQGNDTANPIVIKQRDAAIELKTTTESTPKPQVVVVPNIDVSLSWLLYLLDDERKNRPKFSIDRAASSTHTPRRNDPVNQVFSSLATIHYFASEVHQYFKRLWAVDTEHGMNLSAIKDGLIFVPVLPLFEGQGDDKKKKKISSHREKEAPNKELVGSGVIPDYTSDFSSEQRRSIQETVANNEKLFSSGASHLPSPLDANLVTVLLHVQNIAQSVADGLDYIELMLRNQLVAAIGKVVQPSDLSAFMRFHYRKLFADEFQPNQFSYAVRRPDHYPEGLLSIEADIDGSLPDPVQTIVSHQPSVTRPMKFTLDASTAVEFYGERYVHGLVNHQFSSQPTPVFNLVARARQFSSFILLVGRIASADLFEPKMAIIIKDKDELKLPLLLETLPTPKEFRDAIESLSPEQQRFAKAYRSMQLESTLFGVAVIQIKPQLEKLLNLPNDSLTKEIALLQELMDLFIEYQVPSDLISYDGDRNATKAGKLSVVKGYVAAMRGLIQANKQKSLEESKEKQAYRIAEDDRLGALVRKDVVELYDEEEKEEAPMKRRKKEKSREYEKEKDSKKVEEKKSSGARRAVGGGGRGGGPAPLAKRAHSPAPNAHAAPAQKPSSVPTTTSTSTVAQGQTQTPQQKPLVSPREQLEETVAPMEVEEDLVDYTKIPSELEERYSELDVDGALRPTIINPGPIWTKKFRASLLAEEATVSLMNDEQGRERSKAFDLLDALTKSGALAIDEASLHVVIAATHTFDKTLVDTIIQNNVNPIEKIERSALIMAATIHGVPALDLLRNEQRERVATYSPMLIEDGNA